MQYLTAEEEKRLKKHYLKKSRCFKRKQNALNTFYRFVVACLHSCAHLPPLSSMLDEEEEASDCVGEGSHASKKRVKSCGGWKEDDVAKKKLKGKKRLKGKKLSETRLKSYGL